MPSQPARPLLPPSQSIGIRTRTPCRGWTPSWPSAPPQSSQPNGMAVTHSPLPSAARHARQGVALCSRRLIRAPGHQWEWSPTPAAEQGTSSDQTPGPPEKFEAPTKGTLPAHTQVGARTASPTSEQRAPGEACLLCASDPARFAEVFSQHSEGLSSHTQDPDVATWGPAALTDTHSRHRPQARPWAHLCTHTRKRHTHILPQARRPTCRVQGRDAAPPGAHTSPGVCPASRAAWAPLPDPQVPSIPGA